MLVNFHVLVFAIWFQEEVKIIPFPVSWQMGKGIINFDMALGLQKYACDFHFLLLAIFLQEYKNNLIFCFFANMKGNV